MVKRRAGSPPCLHELDTPKWLGDARRLCQTHERVPAAQQLKSVLDEVETLRHGSLYRKKKVEDARRLFEQIQPWCRIKAPVGNAPAKHITAQPLQKHKNTGSQIEVTPIANTLEKSLIEVADTWLSDAAASSTARSRCKVAIKNQIKRVLRLEQGTASYAKAMAHLQVLLAGAGAIVPPDLERFQQRAITLRDLDRHAKAIGGRVVFKDGPFQGPRPVVLRRAVKAAKKRTRRRSLLRRFPSGQTRKPGSHRSEKW